MATLTGSCISMGTTTPVGILGIFGGPTIDECTGAIIGYGSCTSTS